MPQASTAIVSTPPIGGQTDNRYLIFATSSDFQNFITPINQAFGYPNAAAQTYAHGFPGELASGFWCIVDEKAASFVGPSQVYATSSLISLGYISQ